MVNVTLKNTLKIFVLWEYIFKSCHQIDPGTVHGGLASRLIKGRTRYLNRKLFTRKQNFTVQLFIFGDYVSITLCYLLFVR